MALTVTEVLSSYNTHSGLAELVGAGGLVFATVQFDSSYPTGGEAIAVSDFSSVPSTATLSRVFFLGGEDNAVANEPSFDLSASKILMTVASTGSEVADTTDLSAQIIHVLAYFT